MNRRFTAANANPFDEPDLVAEHYALNNHRAIDAKRLHARLRDLENLSIEIQYRRAFRRLYRHVAVIAACVFFVGFLSYPLYLALREADAQKGLISSEEHLRRLLVNYFCGGLLVFAFCLSAVSSYDIVWEYYVLVDGFVVLLGPEA
jgi:hypothetical protein